MQRNGAVMIGERNAALQYEPLGLSSTDSELACLLDGSAGEGQWFGFGGIEGDVALGFGFDADQTERVSCLGAVSVCVGGNRVVGIVAPEDPAKPAVWFGQALEGLGVEPVGTEGLFVKRPAKLILRAPSFQLEIVDACQMYSGGVAQKRRSHKLLAALRPEPPLV